jgi:UDP-glucose:(heptosyl)LPS alpha-1,3-glucosyltransferase
MRVAFIRQKYDPYGGAERFTQALMETLAERTVEVHVFARWWQVNEKTRVHFHPVKGPGWPSLLRHASFVFQVQRAVKKHDFNLIQSNERTLCQHVYRAGDGVHARWLDLRAPQLGRVRRFTVAINPFHRYLLWLERRLFAHPALRAIVVNSNMVRQEITSRFNVPEERLHTIYNGVDLERLHPDNRLTFGAATRARYGLDDKIPLVLFVGSGFERKGLASLHRGMARARGRAYLWVVGKGRAQRYQRLARELGISKRVTFWGPQEDVVPFYAAADVFALPSIYDPFPTVILEALASGLPAITTAQCGAAEIMTHGREGFILASPQAIAELAEYLSRLYQPPQRRPMAVWARERAEAFPIEKTVNELLSLYLRLLKVS